MAQQKPKPVVSETTDDLADCVILIVKRGPEGADEIIPVAQGDVRPTEVQSIIALGYKAWTAGRGLNMGGA